MEVRCSRVDPRLTLVETLPFGPKHYITTGFDQLPMGWTVTSTRRIAKLLSYTQYSGRWISTVSYIHWRGVPQGPGRGRRPRPGSLRYTPTVNVGKLFSYAPRMAQITAAVVSFRYFPPGREIPGLNFPARRLPRKYRQIHPGRWPSFCMQIVTWHGRTQLLRQRLKTRSSPFLFTYKTTH